MTTDTAHHRDAPRAPISRIEGWGLLAAAAFALTAGFANLGVPSLWHDELVHVYVGKSIAESGEAALPSGVPYYNGTTFNALLASVIKIAGVSEATVRTPSVLLFALNVVLSFVVVRPLLGRWTALLTAVLLAASPWAVAWGREARFYTLQQTLYLAFIGCAWQGMARTHPRWVWFAGAAAVVFALGVLTSYHSILFIAGPGLCAAGLIVVDKEHRRHHLASAIALGVLGGLALLVFAGLMNPLDREAVFERGGLGGAMTDTARIDRFYYLRWLAANLSTGVLVLACVGFAGMAATRGRQGVYSALAFWGPILVLTFLIGYRRPRFMFFAYPFYVAAFAYVMVLAGSWLYARPRGIVKTAAAAGCVVVGFRLGVTEAKLLGDVWRTAAGAHTTLARRHPQWRGPCRYVREHRDGGAVLTTTYLPALYYVGHVDNWFPTEHVWWEEDEAGRRDLRTLDDLAAFMEQHPRGYYLAERWRFDRHEVAGGPFLIDTYLWVERHMERVEEAWSYDVRVYRWGYE